MGFIKNSDGDADHIIERVFDDVGDALREIAEHTVPDETPATVEIPGDGFPLDEKAN